MFRTFLAIVSLLLPLGVHAQTSAPFPSKPIRIVVPTAAAGAVDSLARILSKRMSETLGQPIVVENRAGAAAVVGIDLVAKAPPDGTTFLFSHAAIAMNTVLGMRLPYDPEKDFVPVSLAAELPLMVFANPASPYRTVNDIVDTARKNPDGVSYAVAGVGTVPHLVGEALKFKTGTNLVMVPYRGTAAAVQDTVGGQVPIMIDAIFTASFVTAGKLRALAIASNKRSPLFPSVPTVVEQGFPEMVASAFSGLLAPAGTPDAVVQRMNEAVREALAQPEIRENLLKQGYVLHGSSSQEFREFLRDQIARWTPVVKAAKIQPPTN